MLDSPSQTILSPGNVDTGISILNADVLWQIFMFNTNFEVGPYWWFHRLNRHLHLQTKFKKDLSYHPLIITRRTSQVCRKWRNILLTSPSLWGRLIDLQLLQQPSDHWRMEVIRRTETSPLAICGEVGKDSKALVPFLFTLLTKHWRRIRRLEIHLFNYDHSAIQDVRQALNHEAPHLEVFCLKFFALSSSSPPADGMKLFANNAPVLYEFFSQKLTYSPTAPWVPQLRCLMLSGALSLQKLFLTLESTPLLELLSLKDSAFGAVVTNSLYPQASKEIALPHLSIILLHHRFSTCLSVLGAVIPASSCNLDLDVSDDVDDLSHEEVSAFQNVLLRYTSLYHVLGSITRLTLKVYQNSFLLAVQGRAGFSFYIQICTFEDGWIDLYSALLKMISFFQPSTVVALNLLFFSDVDGNRADISSLLSLFSGLEAMVATQNALSIDLFNQGPIIFPALHTVKLHTIPEGVSHEGQNIVATYPTSFLSFLKRRKDLDYPLKTLNLTQRGYHDLGDLRFLDEILGLMVEWVNIDSEIEGYICGSGMPERLDRRIYKKNVVNER